MRLPRSVFVVLLVGVIAGCAPRSGLVESRKIVLHPPLSVKEGPQHPLDDTVPGVANFGLVSRDVWRGGEPSAVGLKWLADLGVKTIIDLREEGDESSRIPAGVRYVRIPVSAWSADRVDVDRVLGQIEACPKPVFIHCHQGRDRTGLAVAAYRLWQGMTPSKACEELRNFRVNVWWEGPIERRIYELSRTTLNRQKSEKASAN